MSHGMRISYAVGMRNAAGLILLACRFAWGQDISDAPDGATLPLIVEIPTSPVAVRADGGYRIAYEMHLTNWSSRDIILTAVDVTPKREEAGFTLQGEALDHSILGPGSRNSTARRIPPNERVVVFFFLTGSGLPKQFFHRIRYHSAGKEEELRTSAMPIRANELVLQPPLRGAGWKAVNGPDSNTHHRRGSFPFSGRIVVPQRFAIDFLRVNEKGESYAGEEKVNKSYLCYGAEALAVSDGTVEKVKDGIPENTPHSAERAVPMGWETVSGNHVVLDVGSGRYAIYAHLQPGSIRVRPGDHVKAGQVLGLVGNSGNSTEPHLHFHVSDGLALGGDGLPFEIDTFTRDGKVHHNEIPLRDWVVDFR